MFWSLLSSLLPLSPSIKIDLREMEALDQSLVLRNSASGTGQWSGGTFLWCLQALCLAAGEQCSFHYNCVYGGCHVHGGTAHLQVITLITNAEDHVVTFTTNNQELEKAWVARYFRHLEGLYALANGKLIFQRFGSIQLPSSGNNDKEALMHIKGRWWQWMMGWLCGNE